MGPINKIALQKAVSIQLHNIKELTIVVLIISIAIALIDYASNRYKTESEITEQFRRFNAPATLWFEVSHMKVDDTPIGFQPFITHIDREFKYEGKMTMVWEASVYHESPQGQFLLCSGKGSSNNYSKNSTINVPISLIRYWLDRTTANECEVWPFPIGRTCLNTIRIFYPKRWPNEPLSAPVKDFGAKIVESPIACWNTTADPFDSF